MTSREPLTTDQWLERWIRPLTGLGSLALGGRMSVAWLTVSAAPPEAEGAEILMHPNGVVFGSGILQKPFQASQPDDWRDPEHQPLFTLRTMPAALPALLEHWATLEASANPFLELYRQTLWHNDLPGRARYLYLIQALESLHTLEHRADDEASHERFKEKRADAIAAMTDSGLDAETLKFVKKRWGNRPPDSLDRRLRDLIALVSAPPRNGLDLEDDDPIAVEFARLGETTLEGQLRRLRNDLSHGNRNFTERELRPWLRVLESICRAHALRLLELPQSPGPEAAQPHSAVQEGPAGEGGPPSGA